MNDDRAEIGLKKSKSVTFDQIFPLVGYTEGSSYHGLPASKRLELLRDWISAVSEMNELPDVDRVAFGMFLYGELDAVHLSRKCDDRQMKRRTQGKEAEINTKLPFVRDLVRNGQRAMRAGQSDLALAYYSAAQEQIPLLFSIGMKAARIARSKYRLHFAQMLADKVSSVSYLCDYWNLKAHKLSIECMIRRMTPWLDYGLAPQVVFSFLGEGGCANLFELVKNPHLPPRKQIPPKTQQVFDRLGKDLHIYFKLNTSTLFGEDEHLDFPVCWMTEYTKDIQTALDNMRGYLAPDRHFGSFSPVTIGSDYTTDLSRYMQKRFGKKLSECHFKITKTEPVWDWPTSYMTILAAHPEPWMVSHNAMLKSISESYSPELVEARERARKEYLDSLRAGF